MENLGGVILINKIKTVLYFNKTFLLFVMVMAKMENKFPPLFQQSCTVIFCF